MFQKIKEIEDRFEQLGNELVRPEIIRDQNNYQKYTKEHSLLSPIIKTFRRYQSVQKEIESNLSLLDDPDPEIKKLAREEIDSLNSSLSKLEIDLKLLLIPQDPNDEPASILLERIKATREEAESKKKKKPRKLKRTAPKTSQTKKSKTP